MLSKVGEPGWVEIQRNVGDVRKAVPVLARDRVQDGIVQCHRVGGALVIRETPLHHPRERLVRGGWCHDRKNHLRGRPGLSGQGLDDRVARGVFPNHGVLNGVDDRLGNQCFERAVGCSGYAGIRIPAERPAIECEFSWHLGPRNH